MYVVCLFCTCCFCCCCCCFSVGRNAVRVVGGYRYTESLLAMSACTPKNAKIYDVK